jgi:drug/metabolite transporter (DMT)-like permease
MGLLGLILSVHDSWAPIWEPRIALLVFGFAFIGGFLYWTAYMFAFDNLSTTDASILVQGETPAVLLGAYVLLGERLTFVQWIGIGIALYGAWYLSRWLSKQAVRE